MTQQTGFDIEGGQVQAPDIIPPMSPPPQQTPAALQDQLMFTQEQIEKARREEREKHQNALARTKEQQAALKAELEELRKFREQQAAREAAEQKKLSRKQKAEAEKDLSARELLARREEEYQQRFEQMQYQLEQQSAQIKLERQHIQLMGYIQQRVAEEIAGKTVAPQFKDYITGTNQEEVEASIELAKAKTAELMEQFAQISGQQRGRVPVASGPSSMGSTPELQQEPDFTQMTYADYVKNRNRLQTQGKDQGIFS